MNKKYKKIVLNQNSKLSFGKYKGKALGNIIISNPNYIKWCLRNNLTFFIDKAAKELLDKQGIVRTDYGDGKHASIIQNGEIYGY